VGFHGHLLLEISHTVSAGHKEASPELEDVKTPLRRENIATLSDVYGGFAAEKNGSSGRTRTYNPPVNSRMLCH
jgi:hypothetical protein